MVSGAPIVLAAGGTGGHVFPAEALAEALARRGARAVFVTDQRGTGFAGPSIETHRLSVLPLGGSLAGRVRGAVSLARACLEAGRLLRRLSPAAVVGFGGYPSVPALLAARRMRLASVIHEQNAVLGRANRVLARRVDRIAISFAGVRNLPAREGVVVTGNPVRPAILALRDGAYWPPGPGETLRLLVTGGSQGASIFARVVPDAVAALPPSQRARLSIVQQCRPEDIESVAATYRQAGIDAMLAPFFADLPARLGQAHLMIARAGASSVAELCVAGRPAVLVPYPHATDDHQRDNADALAACGAAWVRANQDFTPDWLTSVLSGFLADATPLGRAAAAARALGRPDAAERLADLVLSLAPANGGTLFKEAAE